LPSPQRHARPQWGQNQHIQQRSSSIDNLVEPQPPGPQPNHQPLGLELSGVVGPELPGENTRVAGDVRGVAGEAPQRVGDGALGKEQAGSWER
jgi:hypothetical protein